MQTNTCPFHYIRLSLAESKSSAKVIAGLHRFLVPSLPKTQERPGYTYVITLLDLPPLPESQDTACETTTPAAGDPRKNDVEGDPSKNYSGGASNLLDP